MFSIHRTQSPADVLGLISSSPASVRYPLVSGGITHWCARTHLQSLLGHGLAADPPLRLHDGLDDVTGFPTWSTRTILMVTINTHEQMGICISLSFCST